MEARSGAEPQGRKLRVETAPRRPRVSSLRGGPAAVLSLLPAPLGADTFQTPSLEPEIRGRRPLGGIQEAREGQSRAATAAYAQNTCPLACDPADHGRAVQDSKRQETSSTVVTLRRAEGNASQFRTDDIWGWVVSVGPSPVAQMVKKMPVMPETQVQSLGREDALEKGLANHSSILAWEIPRTEGPGGLPSMGSQRVGLDCAPERSPQHSPRGGNLLCALQDANSIPGRGPLDAGSFFPAPAVKVSRHCRKSPRRTESAESVWWRACSAPSPADCSLRELLPLGPHHTQRRRLFFLPQRRCRRGEAAGLSPVTELAFQHSCDLNL